MVERTSLVLDMNEELAVELQDYMQRRRLRRRWLPTTRRHHRRLRQLELDPRCLAACLAAHL
jgi:hypothetical protein